MIFNNLILYQGKWSLTALPLELCNSSLSFGAVCTEDIPVICKSLKGAYKEVGNCQLLVRSL